MDLKKYFIKDEEITSTKEDLLNMCDVMQNAKMIIDNTKPPFAMAITGKTGSGKSSIINELVESCNNDDKKYNVTKLNVWKNENSLNDFFVQAGVTSKNTFKTEVNQNVSAIKYDGKINNNSENDLSNAKENSLKFSKLKKVGKFILTFIVCLLVTSLIFIFMEYIQNSNIYNGNDVFFVENTYLSYREDFGTILLFAAGFTAIIYVINTLFKVNKDNKNILQINEDNIEDNIVAESSDNISINTEVINPYELNLIIVEDIDKLPLLKMFKVFDELKNVSSCENCIFIVPFDEKVIKRAINAENEAKANAEYRPIKYQKLLDKIFQFNVSIPHISSSDMREYTVNLVKNSIPSFIEEYCTFDELERIIRNIIVYDGVKTPRRVKKILNTFISNKILISRRVANGKIEQSIVDSKNFNYQLAKISVIQAEYKEFYNTLYKDLSYLNTYTELCNMSIEDLNRAYKDIDDDLKVFFTNKYKGLIKFLRQTKMYPIDNISILMYISRVKTEKIYKGKRILGYIMGDEDISELRIQEVLELIKLLDNKEDLKEFTDNNFEKLLARYNEKKDNKIFYENFVEIVNILGNYINEEDYYKFLEMSAINYKYYPSEAFNMFNSVESDIPGDIMEILLVQLKDNLSKDNYEQTFEFIKRNSDTFFDEGGNISEYVNFLVNYIQLAPNPDEVIEELDENFTRIGKIYELNKNIKNLNNIDYSKAYQFIAKCMDNSDLERMVNTMNTILSDEDSVDSCLKIGEKMNNYGLIDVIENNVDCIVDSEENKEENNNNINRNYELLKNLIQICTAKQQELAAEDVIKIVQKALENVNDFSYILSVYSELNKFDRMYFYEIRREFNEVIYKSFHTAKKDAVKDAALGCTRYFKNTRLFLTKLTDTEKKYYDEN